MDDQYIPAWKMNQMVECILRQYEIWSHQDGSISINVPANLPPEEYAKVKKLLDEGRIFEAQTLAWKGR